MSKEIPDLSWNGGDKIKRKGFFILVLFLGLTLSLSMGAVSADNGSSAGGNASTYNSAQTVNATAPSTTNSSPSQTANGPTAQSNNNTGQLTTNPNTTGHSEGTSSTSAIKTIKVLIYNGEYSIASCVTGIEDGLNAANANNLVPGYYFTYATSTYINAAILAGYDVLAMPGGTGGSYYLNSGSISASAIKNFVASGKGYLGICAGAYSGAAYTEDWYYGWGVAPHVYCKHPWVEGPVPVQIQAAGQQLFGYGGTITMAHYNGPAMYAVGGTIVTFATYADNSIGCQGLGAIVGDFYGLGRSVICGVHPELDPKFPDILGNLVVWAANLTTNPTPTPSSGTATLDQIGSAAGSVKAYYEANKSLTASITINGSQITMPQFLYLLAAGTVQANSGTTTPITIKSVNPAPAPSGTFTAGNIQKSEYVQLATGLINFINTNGRVPNYLSTSRGKIPFAKAVYMFSKIMTYYKTYGRLPNYVYMS